MIVIVQAGQTLSGIAQQYGTTYQAIAAASGISNPNLIYAGEKLVIPKGGSYTQWTPSSGGSSSAAYREPDNDGDESTWTPPSSTPSRTQSTYGGSSGSSQGHSPSSVSYGSSSGGGYSGGGLSSVPGVPQSFASCVAFHESTNGTNAAYNGGVYGIISASGINVNGRSVSAQKAAFSQLYRQYGTSPWRGDGCA